MTIAPSLERMPPQNLDAERSVLGACFIESDVLSRASEILPTPDDFYKEAHQTLYAVMLLLADRGEPIDFVTVSNELRARGRLEAIGGAHFLTELTDAVPTSAHVEFYAKIVREKAMRRKMIAAGSSMGRMAYDEETGLEVLVDKAEQIVFGIAQDNLSNDFVPLKNVLLQTFEKFEEIHRRKATVVGIPTGFRAMDGLTGGFGRSNLIIVAARPGMGKTALCMNIAQHVAQREKMPVAVFSLEMSKEEIGQRLLCSHAGVEGHRLRTGQVTQDDWRKIATAMNDLQDVPLYIDDTPGLTSMELRAKARRLKKKFGCDMIVLDYLQLVRSHGKTENRNQELSEISRSLKALAKELSLPVIALSQLSREVEKRNDKRPMLSDLRESGAIEQDADMVCFIYRDDYYNPLAEQPVVPTEFIIAKQRAGPVGTIELGFHKALAKFVSIAPER
ncbi:MAG TPA: replicative DNA helicase [Candidatus Xenobia bacterium]|jgi:replicative DNA helicase